MVLEWYLRDLSVTLEWFTFGNFLCKNLTIKWFFVKFVNRSRASNGIMWISTIPFLFGSFCVYGIMVLSAVGFMGVWFTTADFYLTL